jgi:hypothetical protein
MKNKKCKKMANKALPKDVALHISGGTNGNGWEPRKAKVSLLGNGNGNESLGNGDGTEPFSL